MTAIISITILWAIGYAIGSLLRDKKNKENNDKLEALTNDGVVDLMYRGWKRYQSVHPLQINQQALWQKWIRR